MEHGDVGASSSHSSDEEELSARLREAAASDLEVFRRSKRWVPTAILRTLEVDGLGEPIDTVALARGLKTLGDLVLVAQPGMGKTTTLLQIAEAALEQRVGSPFVVSLGSWSTNGASLLEAILRRPALHSVSIENFRSVAARPGVFLLLDGWNELDRSSRRRAAAEIERLRLELPELVLVVATRDQRPVVPFSGTTVQLWPLSERQQVEIARATRGDVGQGILDQAWHTPGVRELVPIPLYLIALLALPDELSIPTTKEEVLRRFAAIHEQDFQRAEALAELTDGLHSQYLQSLAETATRGGNTTISDANARTSVSGAAAALQDEGQITLNPNPSAVLTALVGHHLLIREREPEGYAFQHQQFQEWYASRFVEDLMCKSVTDKNSRETLKTDILNQRRWEQPILFACERLARGDEVRQNTCGAAILTALEVDPMLAADMVWRASDNVWHRVGRSIADFVDRWHTPGRVDRAVRFMIVSGREDFRNHVWPLITHENDQVHLAALRAGTQFRPSVLGRDAKRRLMGIPPSLRKTILDEIAMEGGVDGLEFAAEFAKAEPNPEVRAPVAEALAFRGAVRHVVTVLRDADGETFDRIAHRSLFDGIADEGVRRGLAGARERRRVKGIPSRVRLASLVSEPGEEGRDPEVTEIIAEMEIGRSDDRGNYLVDLASERFPRAVAEGLLKRVHEKRVLPNRSTERLARAGFADEDEALLDIALGNDSAFDENAEAAAAVLGPHAVGRLIDRLVELEEKMRNGEMGDNNVVSNRYTGIRSRICFVKPEHLLSAIEKRSGKANSQTIGTFAELIDLYGGRENRSGRAFDAAAQAKIAEFVEDWGERLLSSRDSTRRQLASTATLARHSSSKYVLATLERLLEEELRRLREFRELARTNHEHQGNAMQEGRTRWSLQYQRAFAAIRCPEATALMQKYLLDEEFGDSAALVLAAHWHARNEPSEDKRLRWSPDFSRVWERRKSRDAVSEAASDEAEAIFGVIEQLLGSDATDTDKRRAVALATVATTLPHGGRSDIVAELIAAAERRERSSLLTNLVHAGVVIDVEIVEQSIAEVVEAAKTRPWISHEQRELHSWLCLLAFTTDISRTVDIVRALPEQHRTPRALEELLEALGDAPGDEADEVIFGLAAADPRLYAHRDWLTAAFRRRSLSSATRLIGLVAQGAFDRGGEMSARDIWTRIANLIGEHPELRAKVYGLFDRGLCVPGGMLLAQAVAENPDEEGLIMLVELDIEHKHALTTWLTIERVLTKRLPIEDWEGSYEVQPVSASKLRRKLLAMTTDGSRGDVAARYLNKIDEIRDQFGTSESEPRHPNLASGKAWPIVAARKDAPKTV